MNKKLFSLSLIYTLLLALFMPSEIAAQEEQRAFYVHRNDGGLNVMFFHDVDSIVYSPIDIDSIVCEKIVTQEIWTPDTIVRIPIAAIDSITFQTPSTIYKEGVSVIQKQFVDYIVSVDAQDLYLSKDIPTGLLPKIGEKIVTTERSNAFPGGFIGKVRSIEETETGLCVRCDQIMLSEAFERYYGLFDIGASTSESSSQGTPARIKGDHVLDWTHDFGTVTVSYSEGNTVEGLLGFFDGSYGVNISGGIGFPNMRISGHVIMEKDMGLDFGVTVKGDFDTTLDWSIYGSLSKSNDILQQKLCKAPIPIAPGVFFYGNAGLTLGVEGKVSVGSSISSQGGYLLSYNYSQRGAVNLKPAAKVWVDDYQINPIVISGSIAVNCGLFMESGFALLDEKLSKVYWRVEPGLQLSLNASISYNDIMEMGKTKTVYETARDNCNFSLALYTNNSVGITFLNVGHHHSLGMELEDPLFTSSILPTFSNLGYKISDDLPTLTADISAYVFPSIPVGFKVVDEDDETVYSDYFAENYANTLWGGQSFQNYELKMPKALEVNKKYKVYPLLKLFSAFEMLGSPTKEISISVMPCTDGAGNITFDSATLFGHVEDEMDMSGRYVLGFLLSDSPATVKNGRNIKVVPDKDKKFSADVSGLENGTKYYYCAYLFADNKYYYGDVLSFETPEIPDNAVDLGLSVLWAQWNVGASSEGESGGLYGWADANGTLTTFDVIGDDGQTWTSNAYGGPNPPLDICGNSAYDIARNLWGGTWRLPSESEMIELIDNCDANPATINGTAGMMFTSRKNGKSIFLPAAGERFGTDLRGSGAGYYWTGTLCVEQKRNAYRMVFDDYGVDYGSYSRYIGNSVRPVMSKQQITN